jgi:hypothetical protein
MTSRRFGVPGKVEPGRRTVNGGTEDTWDKGDSSKLSLT